MILSKSIFPFKSILFFLVILSTSIFGEGFLAGTLVKTPSGYMPIEQLQIGDEVICYDFQGKCVSRPITNLVRKNVDSYVSILVGSERIFATDDHLFYLPSTNSWVEAKNLNVGDLFLQHCNETIAVDQVLLLYGGVDAYDISVDEYHNFCVSLADIHVHNQLDIAIEFAFEGREIVFEGAAVLVAIGGAVVGWIAGSERSRPAFRFPDEYGNADFSGAMDADMIPGRGYTVHPEPEQEKKQSTEFPSDTPKSKPHTFPSDESSKKRSTDFPKAEPGKGTTYHADKAPGKPTANDGYNPPKKWDGKKVRSPNGRGWGWPDDKGRVWVPSGVNGHGGPHWDVQSEDGKSYENIVRGGRVRGEKENRK